MKKYINPMLSIVRIKNNDIITGSDTLGLGTAGSANDAESAGRRFDDWDAGY